MAREAFAELGYSGASMSEIAGRAGIRKPSLFHHFPTKEALYVEAVGEALAPLGSLVAQAASGDGGFGDRLDELGGLVVDHFGANPVTARLLVREILDAGPFLTEAGRDMVRTLLDTVSSFLAAGMEAGAWPRQDPRHLALSVVAVHLFYWAADPLSGAQIDRSVFHPEEVAARRGEVVRHVRALVGGGFTSQRA